MLCLEHVLHEKRYTTLLERQFKLSGLMQYSLWVLKDLNVLVVTSCLHISNLVPLHDLQEVFFFSTGATIALRRISFKLLVQRFNVLCQELMESVFQIVHFKVSKALDDQLY